VPPDIHDNLYQVWSADHNENECVWDGGAWWRQGSSDRQGQYHWEERCGSEDSPSELHWRCMVCHQGTGDNEWTECPYSNTLEHIVALAERGEI